MIQGVYMKYIWLVFSFVLVVGFQNCSSGFESTKRTSSDWESLNNGNVFRAAIQIPDNSVFVEGKNIFLISAFAGPTSRIVSYDWQKKADSGDWTSLGLDSSIISFLPLEMSDAGEYRLGVRYTTNRKGERVTYSDSVVIQVNASSSEPTTPPALPEDCGNLAHGEPETRIRYESSMVPYGSSCQQQTQTRVCNDGDLTPFMPNTFTESTCVVQQPEQESPEPEPGTSGNLIVNGQFDSQLDSFDVWENVRSFSDSFGNTLIEVSASGGLGQDLSLQTGVTYNFSSSARLNSNAGSLYIGFQFFNSDGQRIDLQAASFSANGQFESRDLEFTVPAGTSRVLFYIWKDAGSASSDVAQVDWVYLSANGEIPPMADNPPPQNDEINEPAPEPEPTPAPTPSPTPISGSCDLTVASSGSVDHSSISSAISAASNGDRICVSAGQYGRITVNKPVRISGSSGAIIDAGGFGNTAVRIQSSGVTIEGFEIRNAYDGIASWNYGNLRILNNKIHQTERFGVILSGDNRLANTGHLIAGNTVYNTVLENRSRNTSSGWARGIAVDVSDGATVRDNCAFENYGEGIGGLLSYNLEYHNNTIYDNFSVQMYFDNVANVNATGNIIFSTGNSEYFRNGNPGQGTLIANESYSGYGDPSYIATNNVRITNNTYSGVSLPFYGNFDRGGGINNSSLEPNSSQSSYSNDWLCSK